jgi:hypothetical protein
MHVQYIAQCISNNIEFCGQDARLLFVEPTPNALCTTEGSTVKIEDVYAAQYIKYKMLHCTVDG